MTKTAIAQQIIDDLRSGKITDEAFDMNFWSNDCNTAFCIAGYAAWYHILKDYPDPRNTFDFEGNDLAQVYLFQFLPDAKSNEYLDMYGDPMLYAGAELLGIKNINTAKNLFMPWFYDSNIYQVTDHYAGDDPSYLDDYKKFITCTKTLQINWSEWFNREVAANAIENLYDHPEYVDHMEACIQAGVYDREKMTFTL